MAIDPDHMEPIYAEIKCKQCESFEPCPCGCGYGVCTGDVCEPYEFISGEEVICSIDVTYG